MIRKLIYVGVAAVLALVVYYGQIMPQSEHPEILELDKLAQANPQGTDPSEPAFIGKVDTYTESLARTGMPVVRDVSDLSSLTLGDEFRLTGVTDDEPLDIDITVVQLDKNDLFTLMHGSIASGGTAIITLDGQSVNIFLKIGAAIFEFGGDDFAGTVSKLGDIE